MHRRFLRSVSVFVFVFVLVVRVEIWKGGRGREVLALLRLVMFMS